MSVAERKTMQRIPGVGPSLARDLADLGIRRVVDLRRRSPERLYQRLSALRGEHVDRCVLYVFRCAVYFASTANPEPERLKWWNWKDGGPALTQRAGGAKRKQNPQPGSGPRLGRRERD